MSKDVSITYLIQEWENQREIVHQHSVNLNDSTKILKAIEENLCKFILPHDLKIGEIVLLPCEYGNFLQFQLTNTGVITISKRWKNV